VTVAPRLPTPKDVVSAISAVRWHRYTSLGVGVWALLSRIFSGPLPLSAAIWLIVLVGILASLLYTQFAQFAAFALTWSTAVSYEYVATWSILAAVCFLHLREIGPVPPTTQGRPRGRRCSQALLRLQTLAAIGSVFQLRPPNHLASAGCLPRSASSRCATKRVSLAKSRNSRAKLDAERTQARADDPAGKVRNRPRAPAKR